MYSDITAFQRIILHKNPHLRGQKLNRYDIKEETGKWIYGIEIQRKLISAGGEAIVWKEKLANEDVAVRAQAFDPFLFTNKYRTKCKIYLASGSQISSLCENLRSEVTNI